MDEQTVRALHARLLPRPLFPEKITSQFDEKEKRLYYSAARTVRGEPKIGGAFNVQDVIDQEGEEGGGGSIGWW